jgi:hypothetical protein
MEGQIPRNESCDPKDTAPVFEQKIAGSLEPAEGQKRQTPKRPLGLAKGQVSDFGGRSLRIPFIGGRRPDKPDFAENDQAPDCFAG